MTTTTVQPAFQVPQLATQTLIVPIVGTSPLIVHRFSQKAKRMILDAQQGKKNPREHRNPEADFHASRYLLDDGRDGFPVLAFKGAIVSAARFYANVTMTGLKQSVFCHGILNKEDGIQLVPIEGTATMREDHVTVGQSTRDLRFRAQFVEWKSTLTVEYMTAQLSSESMLALVDAAGRGVGVGEWRPEKGGMNGTFRVDETRDIKVIG
jgi:hypothetical protein